MFLILCYIDSGVFIVKFGCVIMDNDITILRVMFFFFFFCNLGDHTVSR
jgi:hypothetical protein